MASVKEEVRKVIFSAPCCCAAVGGSGIASGPIESVTFLSGYPACPIGVPVGDVRDRHRLNAIWMRVRIGLDHGSGRLFSPKSGGPPCSIVMIVVCTPGTKLAQPESSVYGTLARPPPRRRSRGAWPLPRVS